MHENIHPKIKEAFTNKFLEIAKWIKSVATEKLHKDEELNITADDLPNPIYFGIGEKEGEYCIYFCTDCEHSIFWSNGNTSSSKSQKTPQEYMNDLNGKKYAKGMDILRHWNETRKAILDVVTLNKAELDFINSINVNGGATDKGRRPIRRIEVD